MILDTVHLLHEAGYDVLPNNKSPLKQGWVRPPNAMDGIPAPLSITVNPHDSIIAKVIKDVCIFINKIALANKWMRKIIPSHSNSALPT